MFEAHQNHYTTVYDQTESEHLMDLIRHRIRAGNSFKEIHIELSEHYSSDDIFLCFHAAQILLKGAESDSRKEYEAYMHPGRHH